MAFPLHPSRQSAAPRAPATSRRRTDSTVKAVLGPTNTGKTHLAIERLCAHSSGAIGFPLRLLAREVYDRVCAIKGASRVALITGEERIEPKDARWLLCTAEAMPVGSDLAFIGIDEAQLSADRERGHIFTDRLLNTRGREETMILGSATLDPMVRTLVPEAKIVSRPRFSTLSHSGARKLSRIPPRSAIVAFSAEQVYAVAEMLRRFRGGAAVVMGALSPETRNKQVALYQSGEVDYLVATDAIGMGLNLDITHVAFAGLSKFDGQRQRRLTTAEMAQIAGRAGRHQTDGTFGTLSGSGGHDSEFTSEEVYAIEEHRFSPLTKLFWREAEPRFDSVARLISDLETPPDCPGLAPAPEAIDLSVLKRLADDTDIAITTTGPAQVRRFWEACSLPDFRQHGAETHARFVARLWEDLRHGHLGADYIARAISDLDNPAGDIDTLQMRIAAIRSWAYIAQRPDWVLARDEMAARARAAEARLSDALHARLTERFVNRRTAVLMKKLGPDAALLSVRLLGHGVLVDDELIGQLHGFRFKIDPQARLADRKLLLAAAERHLPKLLGDRAGQLVAIMAADNTTGDSGLSLAAGTIVWEGEQIARLVRGQSSLLPRLIADPSLDALPAANRTRLLTELSSWLARSLVVLNPLRRLEAATRELAAGPELRALLIQLVEGGGILLRDRSALKRLEPGQREQLRRLGVRVGALDLYVPAMLKPAAQEAWQTLAAVNGIVRHRFPPGLPPVTAVSSGSESAAYRRFGAQALRIDMGDKLLGAAHQARMAARSKSFVIDPALAVSMGLSASAFTQLLRLGGFRTQAGKALSAGASGPPDPPRWRWQPTRPPVNHHRPPAAPSSGAFADLAQLVQL